MSGVGVLVYVDKCIGCRACQVACQTWNGREADRTEFSPTFTSPKDLTARSWKVVKFYEHEYEGVVLGSKIKKAALTAVPYNCLHCVDAPCARACPANAISVSPEGAVVIDQSKCIGCQFCASACPYNVPRFGEDGKAYKCTFCVDRLQAGLEPSCVSHCPAGVFELVSFSEVKDRAERLKAEGKEVYGLKLDDYVGGAARWVFVIDKERAKTLPEDALPRPATNIYELKELAENLAPPFVGAIALAAMGLLALAWWKHGRVGEGH